MAPKKKRKLASICGMGNVTDSALASILKRLQEVPDLLEGGISRAAINRATLDVMVQVGCSDTLPGCDGETIEWEYADPRRTIALLARQCESFSSAIARRRQITPNSFDAPWHIVLYTDEVTPGDAFAMQNKRRAYCFSLSFKEFGPELLCQQAAWVPFAMIRSVVVHKVQGKLSTIGRSLLTRLFCGPESLERAGVDVYDVHTSMSNILFFKLGNVIADEAAQAAFWGWKGASGLVNCANCKNITLPRSGLAQEDPYLRDTRCSNVAEFDLATSADKWAAHDDLMDKRRSMTKTHFEDLEKAYGMNCCPTGILADHNLREYVSPIDVHTHDPMHIMSTIVEKEIFLLLAAAGKEARVDYDDVLPVIAQFSHWPKHLRNIGSKVKDMFGKTRAVACKRAGNFKASCSEILTVFPLLLYFTHAVLAHIPGLAKEVSSCFALASWVHLVRLSKRGVSTTRSALENAAGYHNRKMQEAYDIIPLPKHHTRFHLGLQYERDGWLLDCWTLERANATTKNAFSFVDYTKRFERSATARIMNGYIRQLDAPGALQTHALLPPVTSMLSGAAKVSKSLMWNGAQVSVDDFVIFGEDAGIVKTCVQANGLMVAIDTYRIAELIDCKGVEVLRKYISIGDSKWIALSSVTKALTVTCWAVDPDGSLLVLL